MLFNGDSSQGSKSEFPVDETSAHPASSLPSAQQLMVACSESAEGAPYWLKSKRKLNIVLPENTVVAFLMRVMGSQLVDKERTWQVSVKGIDHR